MKVLTKSLYMLTVACALLLAPMAASAQTPATAADAAPFVGKWALKLEGPMGPVDFTLTVATDGGKVVAEMAGGQSGASKVTDITKTANGLLLKYTIDMGGMSIPAKVTLTPDGAKLKVAFDIMDGQMSMPGTGTKS